MYHFNNKTNTEKENARVEIRNLLSKPEELVYKFRRQYMKRETTIFTNFMLQTCLKPRKEKSLRPHQEEDYARLHHQANIVTLQKKYKKLNTAVA